MNSDRRDGGMSFSDSTSQKFFITLFVFLVYLPICFLIHGGLEQQHSRATFVVFGVCPDRRMTNQPLNGPELNEADRTPRCGDISTNAVPKPMDNEVMGAQSFGAAKEFCALCTNMNIIVMTKQHSMQMHSFLTLFW